MNYKTQMEVAKKGIITKEMQIVAEKEYMEPEILRQKSQRAVCVFLQI